MYQTFPQKIKTFLMNLISKYIVWITIIVILVLYYFFPEVIEVWGKIALIWGPVIIISLGLLLAITGNFFKFRKLGQQGVVQYEIIIGKYEFYLADLIMYLGTITILLCAHLFSIDGVGVTDLIQALIFFILANWIKQIFYRKIIQ